MFASEPVSWLLSLSSGQCVTGPCPSPCGNSNAGVTRAGGLLYAAGHREIMAIPPQLAHTIKGRGGSKDSSFNQAIVWANYIWMKDPKNSPPPWAKPAQNTPNNPSGMRESAQTQGTHTEIYKPWTPSLPLNVSTQACTHTLVHYSHTLTSPAGSHQSVVSPSQTHSHVALGIRSDLSLLLSEEMRRS